MANTANLLRLINEFIVLLLGALMILLAVSRGVALPSRPGAMITLGSRADLLGSARRNAPEPRGV